MNGPTGESLLKQLQRDFIGLDTHYHVADGRLKRRIYLDSGASTLMLNVAAQTAGEFLPHYANSHSRIHFSARTATDAYSAARNRILAFVGADPSEYVCLFLGNGATSALNRAAYYLRQSVKTSRPEAHTVLVSVMEHHSNDLPHRKKSRVRHVPLVGATPELGPIDENAFLQELRAEPIQYAALTMVSNVTGIINPIARLTEISHGEGVPVLVDASQAIAHMPVRVEELGRPDALVFSGHKAYAPGSPGVLIIRKDLIERVHPAELGGGMVSHVTKETYVFADELAEREEAGTPNVVGAVTLAAVFEVLGLIGMSTIAEHEQELSDYLIDRMKTVPGLRMYGAIDNVPRVGVVSFNVGNLDHAFVAAVMNDYHNVAVRNQCFCAHPYVQTLLYPELWELDVPDDPLEAEREINRRRGMVRASLAMYSTRDDVDQLVVALQDLAQHQAEYRKQYVIDGEGVYQHAKFKPTPAFNLGATVERMLNARNVMDVHRRAARRPRLSSGRVRM